MVEVFRCVRDVLVDDGTLWLNLGDSYNNGKQLLGVPWRVALALQLDGWVLRQDIIWHKPNPMPESVRDRCTKAHEYIFLLSKSEKYFIDPDGMKEPAVKGAAGSEFHTGKTGEHQLGRASTKPRRAGNINPPKGAVAYSEGDEFHRTKVGLLGYAQRTREMPDEALGKRNRRSVWTVATRPYKGAHFATFPPALIEPCVLAGSRPGDLVLDPFMGSGTTAAVALKHGRQYLGCELNQEYGSLQEKRIAEAVEVPSPNRDLFEELT
jgi:DNA modification methylase